MMELRVRPPPSEPFKLVAVVLAGKAARLQALVAMAVEWLVEQDQEVQRQVGQAHLSRKAL